MTPPDLPPLKDDQLHAGDADAQNKLGLSYSKGQGVPQDYAEAVRWYRKAAEQGESIAQNNLGLMYARGLGVPQDEIDHIDMEATERLVELPRRLLP